MGSLSRQARRQRDRDAWKAEPVERLEPPLGVPARMWLDILANHGGLVHRLRNCDETESGPLIAELTTLVNARAAEEAVDPADDSEAANADRFEILLERYAALVESGDSPEREEFEREAEVAVGFAKGEGRDIFQRFVDEERRWRRQLPKA